MANNDSTKRWEYLISAYLDETISEDEFSELKDCLRLHAGARDRYFELVKNDVLIREVAGGSNTATGRIKKLSLLPMVSLSGIAILIIGALLLTNFQNSEVATVGETSSNTRWLSNQRIQGEGLKKGSQIKLASGSVEIRYLSGAMTRLHGPALFELISSNSGFLHYGEAFSRADNAKSHGFSLLTHAGNFVDHGTAFLATASLDGYSQLHVTSGAVDAKIPGFSHQRLREGSGLGIEPGEVPVMVRIEQGTETPEFKFPTIPPPTDSDYADISQAHATASWEPTDLSDKQNTPATQSGPISVLLDGKGQSDEDKPDESLFFRDGANGFITIDLGSEIPISKIHTYTWHRNWEDPDLRRRAVQRYILWGCGDNKSDTLPTATNSAGWTRIARVNTDAFFRVKEEPDRPPQQACALFAGNGAIGKFRYLLFEVAPTPMPEGKPRHTFLGEIDVFKAE